MIEMRLVTFFILALCACKREDPGSQAAPSSVALRPKVPPIDAPPIDAPPVDAPPIDAPPIDAPAPGGIRGKITFIETTPASTPASPVVGCKIEIIDEAGDRKFVKTNATGQYRLEVPAGRYRIVFANCRRGMGIGGCHQIIDSSVPVEATVAPGAWTVLNWSSHSCNKCLDASVTIATPSGPIAIGLLRVGDPLVVARSDGRRVVAHVIGVQRIPIETNATAIRIRLADGRALVASGPHPLANGRTVAELHVGDLVDGSTVEEVSRVPYTDGNAYDVLPSIAGAYIADGIPLLSTM